MKESKLSSDFSLAWLFKQLLQCGFIKISARFHHSGALDTVGAPTVGHRADPPLRRAPAGGPQVLPTPLARPLCRAVHLLRSGAAGPAAHHLHHLLRRFLRARYGPKRYGRTADGCFW